MKKIILPILGVLLVVTIIAAIRASQGADELVALENDANNLQMQNRELRNKIVSASSLTFVGEKASQMGMIKPEKFVYITHEGLALR